MHDFRSDYSSMPHPAVLAALGSLSDTWMLGEYGEDLLSHRASKLLLETLFSKELRDDMPMRVFFVPSGTAANGLGISTIGGPSFNSLVSTDVSHSNRHEAGAMAKLGHPILPVPHCNGKLTLDRLRSVYQESDGNVHEACARILSISNATELGTVYMPDELRQLKGCLPAEVKSHIDGARIANSLAYLELNIS